MTQSSIPAPAQSSSCWRKWLRRLLWGGLALIVLPPLLLTMLLLGLDTQPGRDWLVQQVNRTGFVQVGKLEGSLWREMTFSDVRVDTPDLQLATNHLALAWSPYALLLKRIHLTAFKAGQVDLVFKPGPPEKAATVAPTDLRLPVAIVLDQAEIESIRLQKPALQFSSIHFSLSSTGRHHRLELTRLITQIGQLQADLLLDGKMPFATQAHFDFSGEVEGHALHTAGSLEGELRALQLQAKVENPQARGNLAARLDLFAPYTYQMLRDGRIELNRIDPSRLLAGLPQAELDILLDLKPTGEDSAQGQLAVTNHRPGAANTGLIPLDALRADLSYAGEMLQFSGLDARLRGGKLQGAGTVGAGKLALDLTVAGLDLARLWDRQPATTLSGKLSLRGPWLAPDILADLKDASRQVSLQADLGWINPQRERRLQIRQAMLQRGASRMAGKGQLALDGKLDFKLAGDFNRLNPAEFVDIPAGRLSGEFSAEGALRPKPVVALNYRLGDSVFNGETLTGQGRLRLDEQRLADADFWLMLARNRLEARGALGAKNDVLNIMLDWPSLRSLGKEFSGSARGSVRIAGTYADPVLDGQLNLSDLGLPQGIAIKSARLDAHLQQGLQAPLRLNLEAAQASYQSWRLERIQAQVDGSRNQHRGNLSLSVATGAMPRVQLQAELAGALDAAWNWRGSVQQFLAQGPAVLRLNEPASLAIEAGRVELGDSRWQLGKALLHLQQTRWNPDRVQTRGTFTQLAVADWLKLAGATDYASDLVVGGNWDLQLDQHRQDLNGQVRVVRESGDSVWRGPPGNRIPFALRESWLQLSAVHNRIELQGLLESTRYGRVNLQGNARVDVDRLQLDESTPVSLSARGELPQLSAFNALLGPDLQLGGRVAFDVRREGLLKTSRLSGNIHGDDLSVRDLATGVNLNEGTIRMGLADQRIDLQQASFKGGQGSVQAEGVLDLREEMPAGRARISANRLTLISRSDMLLVISGEGELASQKGQINISGRLRADQGDIEYRSADIPKLSEDVVVLGRERAQPRVLPAFMLSLDVDLGEDFRFRGYGLDAKLEGLLRLRAQPTRPLAANGVVSVKEGTYRAWGQRLEIERGQLSFQGAVENPGLDILAMRRNQEVEAGVSVLGTAMNPRVQLYSEPAVTDTEKLSWLLFGHGSEGMEKSDAALLLQAANSLLAGNNQGQGITDEILQNIGIDDIGMRSITETDGKSTQIVTVSKQLGRKLRISLEKSLTGLRDGVKLSLQLSKRWALVTRLGNDESTVGATYTVQFD